MTEVVTTLIKEATKEATTLVKEATTLISSSEVRSIAKEMMNDIIEEVKVINVSKNEQALVPTITKPSKTVRKYAFDSACTDLDKQVYFVKEYFEHAYDEKTGKDSDLKRFQ